MAYLSAVETLVNVAFNWVPIPLTAVTITIEMPAAINAYSMAVAPDSFFRNATNLNMGRVPCWVGRIKCYCVVFKSRCPGSIKFAQIDARKGRLHHSKMLENGNGHLLGGVGILAVKEQQIKADHKGQRGHYAQR